MLDQLEKIEKRYQELEQQIAKPEIVSDLKQLQALAQERASLENIVMKYRKYKDTANTLEETRGMLTKELDEGMKALVVQEIESLGSQSEHQLQELKLALLPRDANDDRDIIMEIRPAPVAKRPGYLPPTSSVCTAAMLKPGAG